MTWKDYLEDYEAKEQELATRALREATARTESNRPVFPAPERFGKLIQPPCKPELCNVWGVIPFHGSAVVPISPAADQRSFDNQSSRFGYKSRDLPKMIDYAKTSGRLGFYITGNPIWYSNLEFLEPLFRELRPPMWVMHIGQILDENLARRERLAYWELTKHGLVQAVLVPFVGKMSQESAIQQAGEILNTLADVYAFLRLSGYEDLSNTVEKSMIASPMQAWRLLVLYQVTIVQPALETSGWIPAYSRDEYARRIGLEPGATQGVDSSVRMEVPYEVGKFILDKLPVPHPETLEGCMEVLDRFGKYDLDSKRRLLYKSIQSNDARTAAEAGSALAGELERAWNELDKYSWVERTGGFVSSVSIGIIGPLVAQMHGVGLIESLGMVPILEGASAAVHGSAKTAIRKGVSTILGRSHLFSLYDFKASIRATTS